MAITELEFPTSGTPTVPTDYAYQNEYIESNAKGDNAISLTNWDDSTTAPEVAEGSAIECNGTVWQVDADTSIATTDATSGVNYLVFDDDAGAFGWNDTAPTWSATLNGWYVSGDRFTGHLCTWDGSASFTVKGEYQGNRPDSGNIILSADSLATISADGAAILTSVNTNNIALKSISFTGSLDAAGDATGITTGISASKMRGATVVFLDDSGYTQLIQTVTTVYSTSAGSVSIFSDSDNESYKLIIIYEP